MRLLFIFLLLWSLTHSLTSRAEYRAFVLKFQAADGTVVKEIISTLDPDQYRGYYPVPQDQKISYTQTWRCPGRTGDFLPTCPNPRSATEASSPPK